MRMTKVVKLYEETYEELKRLQEELRESQGLCLPLGSVIDLVLRDWKATRKRLAEAEKAEGEATIEAVNQIGALLIELGQLSQRCRKGRA